MSELKTAPTTGAGKAAAPDHAVDFNSYLRRCLLVFVAALCMISLMVTASFAPFGWPAKVAIILAVASVNASIVACFLMHLLSEKKMIYAVMGFTVAFLIGLMGLTIWATNDFPVGTVSH